MMFWSAVTITNRHDPALAEPDRVRRWIRVDRSAGQLMLEDHRVAEPYEGRAHALSTNAPVQ
jgi:hypothetical protein